MVELDNEHWASAFKDEVRSALSAQLTGLLGTRDITGLMTRVNEPVVKVTVRIRRFDAWPDSAVQLDATWSVSLVNDEKMPPRVGHAYVEEPAASGYNALVSVEQTVLQDLAQRISLDVKILVQAHPQ
jgi:uncharacterized lipoprotein YmbA